jgi:hypothetical protein
MATVCCPSFVIDNSHKKDIALLERSIVPGPYQFTNNLILFFFKAHLNIILPSMPTLSKGITFYAYLH